MAGRLNLSAGPGSRSDPLSAYRFAVEIEGMVAGGFCECSGLAAECEVHEYREGGVNEYLHRFVGSVKHPLLVLRRGLTQWPGLWEWHRETMRGHPVRRNATVFLKGSDGELALRWEVREALPVKWTGPALNAESSSVAFETVELAHRGIDGPHKV